MRRAAPDESASVRTGQRAPVRVEWPTVYTVLQAPVPAFETFVRGRLARWAPDFLRTDGGVHAHVTLLAPFLEHPDAATFAELGALFGRAAPFDVTFGRLDRFPDGLTYAVPEPDAALRALTARLVERWPECPPYLVPGLVPAPHLSLDHEPVDALAPELVLPQSAHIDVVELVRYAPGDTRRLVRFALGASQSDQ